MFIIPKFQNKNFGQQVIKLLEEKYDFVKIWELDTILQEKNFATFIKNWDIKIQKNERKLKMEWILFLTEKKNKRRITCASRLLLHKYYSRLLKKYCILDLIVLLFLMNSFQSRKSFKTK